MNFAGTGGGNGESSDPDVSDDGRFVVFESRSSDLIAADGNGFKDIFMYDRNTTTMYRVSYDAAGGDSDSDSFTGRISGNGNGICFASDASDLVASDGNARVDIFFITPTDVIAGTTSTIKVSQDSLGGDTDGDSIFATISDDAEYISYDTDSTDIAATDGDTLIDVYLYDVAMGTTRHLVLDENGGKANSDVFCCILSGDGRWVTFTAFAFDLVSGDTNTLDVFLTPVECRL